MKDIENLVRALKQNFSDSDFMPVKAELIDSLEEKYPGVPADLKQLYETLGYGSIGHSHYMIHVPTEPTEIYDEETAAELSGVIIVGDDFAGYCEAYDTRNDWEFGYIGVDVFSKLTRQSLRVSLIFWPPSMVLSKMPNNRLHSDRFSAASRLQTGA
ncbi:hypothetical protein [Marinobacter sp.]|uniref:hypothetical protein n=1 Tax=Marinobacter sp. TaxID=50741 RepID=UPI003A925C53